MENTNNRPVGPMIGLIVILLLIILGGIYFWQTRTRTVPINGNGSQTTDGINQIESQSSSDETNSIDSDLNAYGEAEINSVDNDL